MRQLYGARWLLLVLVVLTTALALLGARQVGVDNAVEIWFVDDDPALQAYQRFQETFGNDEVVVVGVDAPQGVASAEHWAHLAALESVAGGIDGLARARTVANTPTVTGDAATLDLGPVEGPAGTGADPELARRLAADPLLGQLVAADGSMSVALVEMAAMDDIDAHRDGILDALGQGLDAAGLSASQAGIGVVYSALNRASTQDSAAIIGASYLVLVGLLWLLYGRLGPVLLTLVVVGLGATWVMGLYGAAGRDINMVTMVLPQLVLVIGVSDCVHMLTHAAAQDAALPPGERARRGVGAVVWPCLVNTLTTGMGFLALTTSQMPVVRDLGWFSALGMLAAFFLALVLCLSFGGHRRLQPSVVEGSWLQRLLDSVANLAIGRPRAVLLVTAFAVLLAALGTTRIVADTWSIDYLRADHPVRVDSDHIEATYGAYTPLELVVVAEDGVRDPELLAAVARWQHRIEAEAACPAPGTLTHLHEAGACAGWSRSLVDPLGQLHRSLGGEGALPTDAAALEQLLFLYESDADSDLEHLVSADDTRLRLTVGIPMDSARGFGASIAAMSALAELPPGAHVEPGGYLPLYVRMMDYIVSSQVRSFGLAFVVIFAIIGLLFRSARLAALAIPANLLPVLVTLGAMGLLGIRLDVATVTIAAIVIGLVVDDTVQLLYRYREELDDHGDVPLAVRGAIHKVGRPMVITTVVLACGFSVLGLAAIKSIAWFGVLLAIALSSALAADLLVIPALLMVTAGATQREEAAAA